MPTRPKGTERDAIKDGRIAFTAYKDHETAFIDADKHRKKKLLPDSVIKDYEKRLVSAEEALDAADSHKSDSSAATSEEEKARLALYGKTTAIRSEISTAYDGKDDTAIRRAFGSGVAVGRDSTPQNLRLATLQLESFKKPAIKKLAIDAGITLARMNEVKALREQLAATDTAQTTTRAAGRRKTILKASELSVVRAGAAKIRKVARIIFKDQPDVLAVFKSSVTRSTPKKREAKPLAAKVAKAKAPRKTEPAPPDDPKE